MLESGCEMRWGLSLESVGTLAGIGINHRKETRLTIKITSIREF